MSSFPVPISPISPYLLIILAMLCAVTRKIHLHPHPPRLPPPNFQHCHPLGNLARFHIRSYHYRIYNRQRRPRLRRSRLTHRCPPWQYDDVPTNGLHVALRQLELRKGQSDSSVDIYGVLECFHSAMWLVLYCCRDIRVCGGNY